MASDRATAPGTTPLRLTREQILHHRWRVAGLSRRVARSDGSLRRAAAVGLTDSMPRAAVLSLHARVEAIGPEVLDEPALTQIWGPRFSVYVVAADDVAPFTLGRLPTDRRGLDRAEDMAARLADLLAGRSPLPMREAGAALGVHPNALRYASPTGRVRIRWDGARQPTVAVVPPPDVDPRDARHELVRRHVHALGAATAASFAQWAGVRPRAAEAAFAELAAELVPVRTPVGAASMLAADEDGLRAGTGPTTGVRLLPSGDAAWLLWGDDRRLLVADATRRDELWTPRVWPGAVWLDGEIVGVWRRAGAVATVTPWRRLTAATRAAVESEAASMPLPDLAAPVRVTWDT